MTRNNQFDQLTGEVLQSQFIAPWWATNRHVQTIWPRFFQKRQMFTPKWEKLELPDGDFVDLAWGKQHESAKGLLVFFHGLEGSVNSHYANDMMAFFERQGWNTVLMHFRGCSGEINRTTRAYHSGETSDALFLLDCLQHRFPDLPKIAIGFSLGANMLLKLLGENAEQNILSAAVTVSPPMKLDQCALSINQGFSRLYQGHLMKSMVANLLSKMQQVDYSAFPAITQQRVEKLTSFREFDDLITAPLHGFRDADDYYQQCSAIGYLKHIGTPTLILHAADDPFMNENVIPKASELSPFVRCEVSEKGGHVGFMQGSPLNPTIWLHERIAEFVHPYST